MSEELNARIAELEQQLAEARRDNLRQRVEDLSFHAMLYDNACHISMSDIFETMFKVDLPRYEWTFSGDGEDASNLVDDITDWLIEQGVE